MNKIYYAKQYYLYEIKEEILKSYKEEKQEICKWINEFIELCDKQYEIYEKFKKSMENKSFDKIKNEIDEENKNIDSMVKIEMDKIKEENKKQTIEYSYDEENNQNQHKIVINQKKKQNYKTKEEIYQSSPQENKNCISKFFNWLFGCSCCDVK